MTRRQVLIAAATFAALTLISILLLDGPVARAVAALDRDVRVIVTAATSMLEIAFGFPVSKYLTGLVLIVVSLVLMTSQRRRSAGWLLLFVGVSQLTARLVAGVLKNVALRPRPFEAIDGELSHQRFLIEGGSSFPSGHAAHFWGLFFAAAIAFPRTRLPLLVLALAVSAARVVVNDHYVADVIASASIAALVAWAFAGFFERRAKRVSVDSAAG